MSQKIEAFFTHIGDTPALYEKITALSALPLEEQPEALAKLAAESGFPIPIEEWLTNRDASLDDQILKEIVGGASKVEDYRILFSWGPIVLKVPKFQTQAASLF